MYFTQILTASSFKSATIVAFKVYPVRDNKEKDDESTIICKPEQAQGYAVHAIVENAGLEWIADCKREEDANNLCTLMQDIYRTASKQYSTNREVYFVTNEMGHPIGVIPREDRLIHLSTALKEYYKQQRVFVAENSYEDANGNLIYKVWLETDNEVGSKYDEDISLTPTIQFKVS